MLDQSFLLWGILIQSPLFTELEILIVYFFVFSDKICLEAVILYCLCLR